MGGGMVKNIRSSHALLLESANKRKFAKIIFFLQNPVIQ